MSDSKALTANTAEGLGVSTSSQLPRIPHHPSLRRISGRLRDSGLVREYVHAMSLRLASIVIGLACRVRSLGAPSQSITSVVV